MTYPCLAPWLLCAALGASEPEGPPAEAIESAIQRGIEFLRREQQQLGRAAILSAYPLGEDCTVYYALRMSGLAVDDPLLVSLRPRMLSAVSEVDQTYTLSLSLLGLLATDPRTYRGVAEGLVERLVKGQVPGRGGGGFGYVLPRAAGWTSSSTRGTAHWPAPQDWTDPSNTQYAVLALRAAVDHGLPVDAEVFEKAAKYFVELQKFDGGVGYSRKHRPEPYLAMTAGAAGSLFQCEDRLGDDLSARGVRRQLDSAQDRAIEWIERNLHFPDRSGPWPFYSAYAIERLGHYSQRRRFGDHDWYAEGAAWLLSIQNEDGAWRDGQRRGPLSRNSVTSAAVSTSFALLFLTRSSRVHTRQSDQLFVLLQAYGENPHRFDAERLKVRLLAAGRGAIPQLLKALYLKEPRAYLLADECLQALTGENVGLLAATSEEELRRCREAWVRLYMTTPALRVE